MTGPPAVLQWARDERRRVHLSTVQRVWDLVLGLACLVVAVAVHLGGAEAVSRNLEPSLSRCC